LENGSSNHGEPFFLKPNSPTPALPKVGREKEKEE